MTTIIITIAVLLVLSAFFSASETAVTAASRALVHQLAQKGNRRAAIVNRLWERKERLIGAILLGNNLVNILASAIATGALIAVFGEAGIAISTVVMTFVVLVFGEILPKVYAFQHANRVALLVAPVVNTLVFILAPITHGIHVFVRILFRAIGVDIGSDQALGMENEELRGAIELHATTANGIKHERAMLHSVLDLAEVQVGEIMIHRKDAVAINADDPLASIVSQILESEFTRVPLWREDPDNIVGIIHAKALLCEVMVRKGQNLEALDVASLAAVPWFIPETTLLFDQLQAFRSRHEHFALVVDEYGSLMGIVTLEDILEEIVGDISDEHDHAVPGVRPQPEGSYIVEGRVTIRDLNREYRWGLPDEHASTLAGLILHEARRIPEPSQAFMFHGFRFVILQRQRHQITSVRVTPPMEKMARHPPRVAARAKP